MAKSRFLVPKYRVIDAAPIASIVIMLCVPLVPSVIPIVLLQVWLWLRHPRDRSRYLIALGVFALYFGIRVGPPLFKYCADFLTYGQAHFHFRDPERMVAAIATAAATGIIPILYRLLSPCSLAYTKRDVAPAPSKSRGSIVDILFLSLFCAITFVCLRWNPDDLYYDPRRMLRLVIFAICASSGAVLSMRLLARVRNAAIGVNFVAAWVIATLITLVCGEAERFVLWLLAEFANTDGYRSAAGEYVWFEELENLPAVAGLFLLLPFFALVTRCCGVILARTDSRPLDDRKPALLSRIHVRIGQGATVLLLAAICLAPVRLPHDEWVAGWPLNYVFLELTPTALLAGTNEYQTLYFSAAACLANAVCVLLIALAIFPPPMIRSRMSRWKLRTARVSVLVGFTAWMAHTCLIHPRSVQSVQQQVWGSSSGETYVGSPIPALLSAAESEFRWIPKTDRRQIAYLTTRGLDRDMTEAALSLPRLRAVTLIDCDVSHSAMQHLRGSPFLTRLTLVECDFEKPISPILETLPRLESLDCSSIELPAEDLATLRLGAGLESMTLRVDHRGKLRVPEPIKFLTLEVPSDKEQEIEITGAANLEILHLHQSTDDDSDTVTRLRLGRVPKLRILELDNRQKIDLAIVDAPLLTTITDRQETELQLPSSADDFGFGGSATREQIARFSRLAVSRAPYLRLLHADVSECRFDVVPTADRNESRPVITDLLLQGRRDATVSDDGRMSAARATEMVRALARDFDAAALQIHGINVDRELVNEISRQLSVAELTLLDCRIPGDAFDDAGLFPRLIVLDAASFAPNDAQLQRLSGKLPNLRNVRIDGSRITKLPASFRPEGRVYLKGAAQLEPVSPKTIQNAFSFATFGEKELGRFDFDLRRQPDPWFLIHGESAGSTTVDFLRKRVTQGEPISTLMILSPSATSEDFRDYDWSSTEVLQVIDARIDTETVNSWDLSGVQTLNLSRTDVSLDVLTAVQQKPHNLTAILLNDIADTSSRVPDLSRFADLRTLELRGRAINESDIERLIAGVAYRIDLERCELSAAAIERIARHQATGNYPQILTGPRQELEK